MSMNYERPKVSASVATRLLLVGRSVGTHWVVVARFIVDFWGIEELAVRDGSPRGRT